MISDGWNRLTNAQRAELVKLPVWTTDEDRHRALAYTNDRLHTEAGDAITAVRTGQLAPANLGEILAVARYEDAGWMPDGNFTHWRRWTFQGLEQLEVNVLVQWLGLLEADMQRQLTDLETRLVIHCQEQDRRLTDAHAAASRARQRLHEHQQTLILARLSIGDLEGAREITRRVPTGAARDQVESILAAAARRT